MLVGVKPALRWHRLAILLLVVGCWLLGTHLPFRERALPPALAVAGEAYRLSDAEVLHRVLAYIRNNYVDPARIDAAEMLEGGLRQLARMVPELLAAFHNRETVHLTIDQATRRFPLGTLTGLNDLERAAKEILAFIDLHYHGKLEAKEIEYAMIEGMLNALDPHSNLLTPKIYNEFKIGTKGNFGGIGIAIGSKEGQLMVIAPIEGTPAARAGLKTNDRITRIGEESTINMSLTEAVEKLRGRVGTSIALTIERTSRLPFTVTLKRAIIKIDSVQSALLTNSGHPVGYVKMKSFQENTDADFVTHMAQLHQQAGSQLHGLILDLRNNPGGLLQQAVAIADHFLDAGVIVSTVGAQGRFIEQETAHASGTETRYPVVILVNEGSASASEIVAGALQHHRRALVVGMRSFGKGSVQTVYDLRDGSALKLTIAEYLTGGKQSIQTVGVNPDVELLPVLVEKTAMNLMEDDHPSERDLEKHLAGKENAAGEGARIALKPSPYRIRYVSPPDTPRTDDEVNREEYSSKLRLDRDFPVQFAKQLLLLASKSALPAAPALAALAQEMQEGQERQLETALKELGLNWQRRTPAGKPQLQLTYQLLSKEGAVIKTATAGEEAQLMLTARNIGSGPFVQLIGSTKAEEPFLDNKEFVFGFLAAGAGASWSVPFKAPAHMTTSTLPVAVAFEEGNLNRPASFTAMVPIQGIVRPRFAYSYRLGPPLDSKVRPQGLLPPGKSIPLVLEVKNVGAGSSAEAVATIRNLEGKGPFIEVGRVKLGKIAPGATARAAFRLRLHSTFESASFKMEIGIVDTTLLESITNQLEFTVGSGAIQPPAGPWYQGPQIQLAGLRLPLVTAGARQRVEGEITDDQQVKDLFIFVGEEKVYYQANASDSTHVALNTEIPLKVGANLVTIAARDNNDLLSRQTMVILRTADGATAMKQ